MLGGDTPQPSALFDLVDESEAAHAVHRNHPYRLLDVMARGELEGPKRRLDVHRLHRGAQLVTVTRKIRERQVRTLGGVGPGRSVRISSASICLVDRVEVNGGALKFSSPIGLSGGTFTVGGNGRLCYNGLC